MFKESYSKILTKIPGNKEKTTNIVEIWPPLLLLLTPKTYK